MTLSEPTAYHHEQNYSATDRKTLGIHYTPDSIVDYIVRQTLAPCFKSPDFLLKIKILASCRVYKQSVIHLCEFDHFGA